MLYLWSDSCKISTWQRTSDCTRPSLTYKRRSTVIIGKWSGGPWRRWLPMSGMYRVSKGKTTSNNSRDLSFCMNVGLDHRKKIRTGHTFYVMFLTLICINPIWPPAVYPKFLDLRQISLYTCVIHHFILIRGQGIQFRLLLCNKTYPWPLIYWFIPILHVKFMFENVKCYM